MGLVLSSFFSSSLLPQPIIAIEEPEAHLHPILLASTWDVIEALRAQTVVTTNSGELLSTVPMKYLRRLVRKDDGVDVHRLGELPARERALRARALGACVCDGLGCC